MRRFAIVVAVALASSGCKGFIRAGAVAPLIDAVSARHDAYVEADEELDANKKATYLRSTEILRAIVDEALGGQAEQ